MTERPMRVYIAGPYSSGDQIANVRAAVLAMWELMRAGHAPFVPHLCHFADYLMPQAYETWMLFDLRWLEACHCVVRLPGHSPGADREVDRAKVLGLPVYFGLDQFFNSYGREPMRNDEMEAR